MVYMPDNLYEARVSSAGTHKASTAGLNTLWANGAPPPVDFIKIDCEGTEPDVLKGAATFLAASNLLGADVKSHFHVDPSLPYSHLAAVNTILVERRLRIANLAFQGVRDADQPWNGTCNVLFTRHLLDEHKAGRPADDDLSPATILKTIAIFDVYGLVGPAIALTRAFREVIAARIDADTLHNKLILSPRTKALEAHLPHLSLGLWTRAKKWLGR